MSDYQMPLFDRYDLSVEFERRLGYVRRWLTRNRDRASRMKDDEVQSLNSCEICPIELMRDEAVLSVAAEGGWELHVPYRGDDELWHLYPVDVVEGTLGEVFRGHLILRSWGSTEELAWDAFNSRLDEIDKIIAQQTKRIAIFDEACPELVLGELRKARRVPGAPVLNLVR